MKSLSVLLLAGSLPFLACSSPSPHAAPRATDASAGTSPASLTSEPWSAPALEHVTSIRDGRTGERIDRATLLDALAEADAVFLGETHVDETTHRVELDLYAGLLERRAGRVVLALEMFERDVQPALDAYLRGEIDEPTFLARSRPWSNYRTAYRRLIEHAKAHGTPVVASNFPAPLRRTLGEGGLDALPPADRAHAPAELKANTPAYWRRVDNAIRGHAAMMGAKPAADDERLLDTQSLWDNTMGESCALALARYPGSAVVHVNGGFHSEYHDGTARQFALRAPHARVKTVAIVPCSSPFAIRTSGVPVADYVVFAEERARDVDDGTYAAHVTREQRYLLHVPATATPAVRAPLLVWLADDGEAARDAIDLWRARLGDACAIAVLEAPYRETQEDLVEGGRWFWNDTFRQDLGPLREGILGVVGYLVRNHSIDAARIVVAGEGTGATVVAATTMLSDETPLHGIALRPSRFAQVKDFPLPLPELRGDAPPVARALEVVAAPRDEAWWHDETEAYRGVGLDARLAVASADPWDAEAEGEARVRAALGLAPRGAPADAPRVHRVVDGPRARAWARREAFARGARLALFDAPPTPEVLAGRTSTELASSVRADDFRAGGAPLPRASGPFGGTTLVVLPDGLDPAEVAAWEALASEDPLNRASRFHRLVLARASGERDVATVLRELQGKNRKNVLIVPATWCADGATMRALRRATHAFEDTMTLAFRPGLGGLVAR